MLGTVPSDSIIRSVTADKAFDTDAIITRIGDDLGALPVIPARVTRRVPRPLETEHYKTRNLVERFFCRVKQFRRIATRYDKLSQRFASFLAIAAAYVWLCSARINTRRGVTEDH